MDSFRLEVWFPEKKIRTKFLNPESGPGWDQIKGVTKKERRRGKAHKLTPLTTVQKKSTPS